MKFYTKKFFLSGIAISFAKIANVVTKTTKHLTNLVKFVAVPGKYFFPCSIQNF